MTSSAVLGAPFQLPNNRLAHFKLYVYIFYKHKQISSLISDACSTYILFELKVYVKKTND